MRGQLRFIFLFIYNLVSDATSMSHCLKENKVSETLLENALEN